jgi:ketosteroid isomerase-like protein
MKALVCIAVVLFVAPLHGEAARGGASQQSAEQVIRERLRAWDEAFKQRDVQAIGQFLTDDFKLTDATGAVLTKAEYLMSVVKSPEFGRDIPYASEDVKVVINGNSATVTGRSAVKGRGRGRAQAFAGTYRFTDRWVNQNGTWRAAETRATSVTTP